MNGASQHGERKRHRQRVLARRLTAAAALILILPAAVPRAHAIVRAVASFAAARLPYLPGSSIPLRVNGMTPPYRVTLTGPGSVNAHDYDVPSAPSQSSAMLVAANAESLAARRFTFASPPDPARAFIAVASYDDGIVIHDAASPFDERAVLGIGGAPSDVAIGPSGVLAAGTTDGGTLTIAHLEPWRVRRYDGVLFSDEIAIDAANGAVYATDRDVNGAGALTRIARDGTVKRRILGMTAEGIAVDAKRRRIYVANVNDGTISIVDADTMVELRRVHAVARVFSLALSADGTRLYAVSNQSTGSPFAAAGSVVALDTSGAVPHVIARSAPLDFPVGVALDAAHRRLFVTDERDNVVDVLDARTLRPVHAPLDTCTTPWKPTVDGSTLYVPCARANEIDLFSTIDLRREANAPFPTGGYPLAVAVWHPHARVVR